MLNSYYSNTRTGEVAYTPNQNAFAENSNVARPQVITTNHYGQQSYANSGTEHRVYGQRTNPSNSSRGNTYQYAQFCKRIRQDLLKISTQSLLDFAIGLDNAYKQGNTKAFIVREIPNLNIYAIKGPTKVCPEFKLMVKDFPAAWSSDLNAYVFYKDPQAMQKIKNFCIKAKELMSSRIALEAKDSENFLAIKNGLSDVYDIGFIESPETNLAIIKVTKQVPELVRQNLIDYIKADLKGFWSHNLFAWCVSSLCLDKVNMLIDKLNKGDFDPGVYKPRYQNYNRNAQNAFEQPQYGQPKPYYAYVR